MLLIATTVNTVRCSEVVIREVQETVNISVVLVLRHQCVLVTCHWSEGRFHPFHLDGALPFLSCAHH